MLRGFSARLRRRRELSSAKARAARRRLLRLEPLEQRALLVADLASIQGTLFADADADGQRDPGESPLAGATVLLDLNNNGQLDPGEPQQTTDASGAYSFTGLAAGEYVVRQITPSGLFQTAPQFNDSYYAYLYAPGGQMQPARIHPQSGAVERLGTPIGGLTERLHGLVRTNAGQFFGINGWNARQEFFYSLDLATNQLTQIGQLNVELAWGLAYDPASDRIYGLADSGNGLLKLATFDRTTGQATLIGPGTTQLTGTSGIAFDTDRGVIVAFDNADDQFWQFDAAGNPTLLWDTGGLDGWGLTYNGETFVQHAQGAGNNNLLRSVDPYRQTMNANFLAASEPISMEGLDYYRVEGGHLVYLSAGETLAGIDFGSTAVGASLSGVKWKDDDGDGVRDPGEPPLEGVVVYLDDNDDGVRQKGGGVEPDDFADSQLIGDATEGVTLNVAGNDNTSNTFFKIQVRTDSLNSTGEKVFAHDGIPFFLSGFRFRADFDEPMAEVSLDYVSSGFFNEEQGTLLAFDSSGQLLEQYTTSILASGAVEAMTIARDEADIAFVVAYSLTGFGRLDNLVFGDDPEPFAVTGADGSYAFGDLPPGDYVVREEVPPNYRRTAPIVSGARLFATNTAPFPPNPDVILELNPATGAVMRALPAPVANGATNTGLAYDGLTLYFLSDSNDTLYELDPDSGAIRDATPLPSRSYGGLAALGGHVYALDSINEDVLVFDPVADLVTATLDLNVINSGLSLSDGLGELSATGELVGFNSSNVVILNAATGKLTNSFPLPSGFAAHSLTAIGNEIFVGYTSPTKVDVYRRNGSLARTLSTTFGVNGLGGGGDTSGAHRVRLAIGQSLAGLDFGNQSLLSEIHGLKWSDNDGDGARDAGEPPLAGVVVYLDQNDDGVRQTGSGVEPDDFAELEILNDATEGVTLAVANSSNVPSTFFKVQAQTDSLNSTGNKVFSESGIPFWTSGFRFRADFDEPVAGVSLDYISSGFFSAEQGTLLAFDSNGLLLEQYTTSVLANGAVEAMTVSRDEADVAFVVAFGLSGFGRLDNLVFGDTPEPFTVTDAEGAYAFTGLVPGDYVVREETPANYERTFPIVSGARLFATNTSAFPNTILEVQPVTGAIVRTLPAPVPFGFSTTGLAFDGTTLFFLSDSNDTLYELDPATGSVVDSTLITSTTFRFYGGLAARGGLVYILDSLNDDLLVFDPVSDVVTTTLDLNALNPGLFLNDGLGELAATGELLALASNGVVTINPATGLVTGSFPLSSPFSAHSLTGIGAEIFVGFAFPNKVDVFRRDGTLVRSLPTTFSVNALGGFAVPDDAHRISLAPAQVLTGVDFGNDPLPAEIHGLKFSDSDGDGVRDAGEPPLAGTAIYLDANNDGVRQFGGALEPDNFPEGAQLNRAVAGAVLTAVDSSGNPSSGGVVTARTDANSSTGTKVFGGSFSTGWSSFTRLRIDFDEPVSSVQIDAIADFGGGVGRLQLFAADGSLLATLLTGTLASDQFQTLSAVRPQADIAFAIADSNTFSAIKLDNLRFGDGVLEPFTRTAADGTFAFPDLLPGEYVVREEVPEHYTQTLPAADGAYQVTLAAGQVVSGLLFGNDPDPSEIRGQKWSDLDADGRRDAGEPPLSGVTVYLDANDNGLLDEGELSTITGADGGYEFTDLLPDDYVVREMVPAGYERTFPRTGPPRLFASNVFPAPNRIFELNPATGAVINDFVSPFPEGGIFEGLAFDGSVLYLASSNDNRLYQVDPDTGAPVAPPAVLPPGTYGGVAALGGLIYVMDFLTDDAVIFDPQSQTVVGTLAVSGFNVSDAFGELAGTGELIAASSTSIALIDPATGAVKTSFPLAAGTFGPGGVAGIGHEIFVGFTNRTIDVYDRSGNRLRTLTGTPDVFGLAGFASSDDAHRVALGAGEVAADQDFGNRYVLVEMHGTKFHDLDSDGQREEGEPPLVGVTVYVDANDNGLLDDGERQTVTDASGNYAFTALPAGDYVVREIVPAGYVQTAPREASDFRFLAMRPSTLVEPDLATGTLGAVQPLAGFFTGLDTHPQTGQVYAARFTLEVLDTVAKTQTSIGTIRNAAGSGVAMQTISFAPDGTLYGLSAGGQLHTIDLQTAVATFVVNLSPGFVNSIEFGPDGTLYGAFVDLITIDLATGQRLRLIEAYDSSLGDLDFAPDGFLYAPNSFTRTVLRIDPLTGDSHSSSAFSTTFSTLASQFTTPGPIGAHRVHLEKGEVRRGLDFGNHNDPPTADAAGPYDVLEGGSVTLAGLGSDLQEPAPALTFVWDLDGDGLFGEAGAAAERGDETGASPVFSAAGLDGPSEVVVRLRVVDSAGAFGEDTAIVRVANVAPVIGSLAVSATLAERAIEGQAVELLAHFSDAGLPDTHTAWIHWGEDAAQPQPALVEQGAGSGTVRGSHAFVHGGIYTVRLTVIDDDGDEAFAASLAVIVGVGLIDGQLLVVGSHAPGQVTLNVDEETGQLKTHADFLQTGNFRSFDAAAIQAIVIHLGNGDDHFTIAGGVEIPAIVHGGGGNDHLNAGGGPSVLIGGAGDDVLTGGIARNILIGGLGSDILRGQSDEDLLIGGMTLFDDHDAALAAVLQEWTSSRTLAERIANLRGAGTGPRDNGDFHLLRDLTIFDDQATDQLQGGADADWLLSYLGDEASLGSGDVEN